MAEAKKKPAAKKKATAEDLPVPLTMEEILAKKKARTRTVKIQLDGEIVERIKDLQQALIRARQHDRKHNKSDTATTVEDELDSVILEGRATEVAFTFKSIGRAAFETLLNNHKPTRDQKSEGMTFNPDTFAPALLSASSVDPAISPDDATTMFNSEEWNSAELAKLFLAAQEANVEAPDVPLSGSGIESTTDFISSLITASNRGSRTRSS